MNNFERGYKWAGELVARNYRLDGISGNFKSAKVAYTC